MGRQAILICTAAVERTVHRHLDDQLHWLGEIDPGVSVGIARIQAEELEHLTWAETTGQVTGGGMLDRLICWATDLLSWLSTYGASARMAKTVRR